VRAGNTFISRSTTRPGWSGNYSCLVEVVVAPNARWLDAGGALPILFSTVDGFGPGFRELDLALANVSIATAP
jgi:hypothetical protein